MNILPLKTFKIGKARPQLMSPIYEKSHLWTLSFWGGEDGLFFLRNSPNQAPSRYPTLPPPGTQRSPSRYPMLPPPGTPRSPLPVPPSSPSPNAHLWLLSYFCFTLASINCLCGIRLFLYLNFLVNFLRLFSKKFCHPLAIDQITVFLNC